MSVDIDNVVISVRPRKDTIFHLLDNLSKIRNVPMIPLEKKKIMLIPDKYGMSTFRQDGDGTFLLAWFRPDTYTMADSEGVMDLTGFYKFKFFDYPSMYQPEDEPDASRRFKALLELYTSFFQHPEVLHSVSNVVADELNYDKRIFPVRSFICWLNYYSYQIAKHIDMKRLETIYPRTKSIGHSTGPSHYVDDHGNLFIQRHHIYDENDYLNKNTDLTNFCDVDGLRAELTKISEEAKHA